MHGMAPRRKPREEARQARHEVYRQHIFAAAEQVFAERGYEAAKVQEISKVAGLSLGTIYEIFPGKTELFRGLLEQRGQEILDAVRDAGTDKAPPREALETLIAVYIGWFVDHPGFLRMHLRSGSSWALTPAGTEAQVEHWQDIHLIQADIFRRGVAERVFVDEDPAYLAKTFSVMDQVLLADWVGGGMREDRATLVARLTRQVERSFFRAREPRAARAG
jgi:AcrR family transcriptional regulator